MFEWVSFLEKILQSMISPLEWVMLFAVVGGGVYLMIQSKGVPLLKLKSAFELLFKKEK